jgi:hypothetical protein
MRKARSVALLGAGRVTRTFIARIPHLADCLGPVKSFSPRVASRIVNSLRAGHAVRSHADLRPSGLLLVCVPDDAVERTQCDLAAAYADWHGCAVVLCESRYDSTALAELRRRGAATASVSSVPGMSDRLFVAEGDRAAVRQVRALLHREGVRILKVQESGKSLVRAGAALSQCVPHIAAASEACLRGAGLTAAETKPVVQAWVQEALRAYRKAGRRTLTRFREALPYDTAAIRTALEKADPEMSGVFVALVAASRRA